MVMIQLKAFPYLSSLLGVRQSNQSSLCEVYQVVPFSGNGGPIPLPRRGPGAGGHLHFRIRPWDPEQVPDPAGADFQEKRNIGK